MTYIVGNKKRVVIGITPAYDKGITVPSMQEGFLLRRMYTDVLEAVGAIPLILNPDMPDDFALQLCDGIVISGGEDVPPQLYGAQSIMFPEEPIERATWEIRLLKKALKRKVPVLGVCYGMQLLAVIHGGSLHQNIEAEVPGAIRHYDHNHLHNRSQRHKVTIEQNFLGFEAGERPWVASRHHQAISRLPDGFDRVAVASDGIIEAIKGPNMFGVQWHPESDETGVRLYRRFVEYCERQIGQLEK